MRTNAKRWLMTLVLAAFGAILGQNIAAESFHGRPGAGMSVGSGFGGRWMAAPRSEGMGHPSAGFSNPRFGEMRRPASSVPLRASGRTIRPTYSVPARRVPAGTFRGQELRRGDRDVDMYPVEWVHGGWAYAGWYGMPWYWTPWTFGIGWDPFWYSGYWGPWTGYYYGSDSGEIKLKTDHKTAEVYIDGAYAGQVKDLKTIHLRPGAYELEIRSDDGGIFQDRVYVLAGKTLKITPEFKTASAPAMREGS